MEHNRICVAGSINVDLVAYLGDAQDTTRYADGRGFQMSAGGKSLNTAMTIAALTPVQLLGRVGEDDFGAFIARTVATAGIGVNSLIFDPEAGTGIGHVRVSAAGEYDTVVIPGANHNFAAGDVDRFLEKNTAPDYAVLNLEVPLPTVRHAALRFRALGATVVLNLSPVQDGAMELLPLADVVVLNREEAQLVLGQTGENDSDQLLQALRDAGSLAAVLTLGSEGAAYIDGVGGTGRIHGTPAKVVNTIGAGDTFLGAFVAGLASGRTFAEALIYADTAGRLVCVKSSSYLVGTDRPELEYLTRTSGRLTAPDLKASESTHG
ncbi:PfkB family carbohydrate kinase [Arthrobacter zhaoxinii]|uniref:PfkB family carbohydrate kinase n=1 Tax=Arthrobacter zhaoxinii TaxID=2964616 RepID=UPI002103FD54|nr:PfkB family carbohydrate kinase [Arthrobacter zhaoxinii]MCQ2000703.1 PfkB family carbohydrate kinase [Arthrobacter zhaoxinii]